MKKIKNILIIKKTYKSQYNKNWIIQHLENNTQVHPFLENYKIKPFYGWIKGNNFKLAATEKTLLNFITFAAIKPIVSGTVTEENNTSIITIQYYNRISIGLFLFTALILYTIGLKILFFSFIFPAVYSFYVLSFYVRLKDLKDRFSEFFNVVEI